MLGDSGTNLLDKYQVLDQIGEGTYGQVYRARCRASGAALALKKIRLLSESQQGLPLSLVREIKILSKLSHRCMVQLVEVVTSRNGGGGGDSETGGGGGDGDLYLVMEYVDHDLSGLLDVRHPFSELEIKCILKQLLEVLMYIHGAQVRVLGSNTAAQNTPDRITRNKSSRVRRGAPSRGRSPPRVDPSKWWSEPRRFSFSCFGRLHHAGQEPHVSGFISIDLARFAPLLYLSRTARRVFLGGGVGFFVFDRRSSSTATSSARTCC